MGPSYISGPYPGYHQPSDLPNTLHYKRMASTVHWLKYPISPIGQDTKLYRFEKDRLEFSDEVEAFHSLTMKAAEEATKIPGTSALSLWKLKQDRDWLERLDRQRPRRKT